jgi:hypothetical protein
VLLPAACLGASTAAFLAVLLLASQLLLLLAAPQHHHQMTNQIALLQMIHPVGRLPAAPVPPQSCLPAHIHQHQPPLLPWVAAGAAAAAAAVLEEACWAR